MGSRRARWRLPVFFCAALGALARAEDADRKGIEFFENKIRPLLADHCYKCHSAQAEKLKGGLYLDSREGLLKGGKSGLPAIVPGDAEKSLLLKAIRYADEDLRMPPKQRLAAEQVKSFETWIAMGAPDPRTGAVARTGAVENHWAFKPVGRTGVPARLLSTDFPTGTEARPTTGTEGRATDGQGRPSYHPIDAFVLQKLAAKGLEPSPPADKLSLLRRATFDLTGLPPSPEELDAFLADASPEAFAKVVDRLLASPRYGERWGRHWLDVVRYGESHGYEQNHLRPNAWHYRDYVIRAFNEDKPYTRFVAEQLAGDVLALAPGDPAAAVATGFLVAGVHDTVGNQAEEGKRQQRADDLDDIVSTTGSVFLGLTVGCAKCHDHKFDPIPQRDFYRLAAVFAGVRHEERALPSPRQNADPNAEKDLARMQKNLTDRIEELDALARQAVLRTQGDKNAGRPAVSPRQNVEDLSSAPVEGRFVRLTILATSDGAEPCIDEMEVYAEGGAENLALASKGAKATASSLLPGYAIHQVAHLNDGKYGNEWSWIGRERGAGWAQIELPASARIARIVWSRDGVDKPRFNDRLPKSYRVEISGDGKAWRTVATGDTRAGTGVAIPTEKLLQALSPAQREQRGDLIAEREKVRARQAAAAPPKAYIGRFSAPDPVYLLKRGDVMQRGEIVAPGALTRIPVVAGTLSPDNPIGTKSPDHYATAEAISGEPAQRLALAKWICDENNPLTARVIVNRVWQYHFGRGIAATPSDFGANGVPPTHPELLDWLARDFMDNGWTLKRLHRQIMLSQTYRQSHRASEKALAADAGNLLLWRMPLRRLEAEAIRDSILSVSGKLNLQMGGPGFQLFKYRVVNIAIYEALDEQGPAAWRRTVYQQTPRAIREDLLASYDLPESAQRAPRREVTTTPLQALASLNSSFVVQQAGFFAERLARDAGTSADARIERAFRLAFGRGPSAVEISAARELVSRQGLAELCRTLFNANEFLTY